MPTLISPRALAVVLAASTFACNPDCSGGARPTPADAGPAEGASQEAALAQLSLDAGELDPLCAAILKEENIDRRTLETEDRTQQSGPRLYCIASPRVAWALRVDPPDGGRSVRQTLIFAGADKARARQVSTVENVEWPPVLGRHAAMFDFDRDGIPEFFSVVPMDLKTFAPAVRNLVTYKNGKISPYPTGGTFLVDGVDHGDLRVSYDLGKRTVCEATDEGQIKVDLTAHGLPNGHFSLDDAAAAAFAARKCPSMPAATDMFLPSISQALDARDLSLSWALCSRIRGKSADAVIAELQAACAPHAEATKKCSGPCRHLPDALTVAKFVPPVQAKDPPSADAAPAH